MLYVCPQSQLERTLSATGATHLISLLSTQEPVSCAAGLPAENRLHLAFHDIDGERPGLAAPADGHIEALLGFAESWGARSPLVIHCHAGISRSPAAAYVIAAALSRQADEWSLARLLRARAPTATPNGRMVALADARLCRQGRMIAAIRSIGRGADAFEGAPFGLPVR